ncbi:MAG: hypothetical protein QF713_02180 [Dehalococcoidales bacterium]|jgi:hypothetical protein|nr:hypothetical protein [Dehalococcoidales bacterium]MDP7525131.1 hypothetical protein [Dehalococcoidales bacterium]
MPAKSRRRKGKYSFQAKTKGTPASPEQSVQPPLPAQTRRPAATPVVQAKSVGSVTSAVRPVSAQYLYIKSELRTIGILAGVTLAGLVVLALIIS